MSAVKYNFQRQLNKCFIFERYLSVGIDFEPVIDYICNE